MSLADQGKSCCQQASVITATLISLPIKTIDVTVFSLFAYREWNCSKMEHAKTVKITLKPLLILKLVRNLYVEIEKRSRRMVTAKSVMISKRFQPIKRPAIWKHVVLSKEWKKMDLALIAQTTQFLHRIWSHASIRSVPSQGKSYSRMVNVSFVPIMSSLQLISKVASSQSAG